jgi:hypothetical protein
VLGAFLLRRRELGAAHVARVIGGTAATVLVVGALPVVRTASWSRTFADSIDDAPAWDRYAHGLVSEALGLILRSTDLGRPSLAWSLASTAVAASIFALLVVLARRGSLGALGTRHDLLLGGCAYVVTAMLVLRLPGFSPYYSMKLGGYGAPMLVLTAFAVLAAPRPPGRVVRRVMFYTQIAAAYLFLVASTNSIASGFTQMRHADRYANIATGLPRRAADAVVELDVRDPWAQSWAVYYLRDHPLVVRDPSVYLTELGLRPRTLAVAAEPEYRMSEGDERGSLWYADGYTLRALPPR